MLERFFHRWEQSIFDADAGDRRPQPFGWGLEEVPEFASAAGQGASEMVGLAAAACAASDDFYAIGDPLDIAFDGHALSFDSPLPAADPELRRVHARMFESPSARGRAVIVVPQWNADEKSMIGACGLLNRFGLSALRLTLPYHEHRRPARMKRADAMVSPVLGRTLQSVRRAVLEVRLAVSWLRSNGYRHIGLMGTSLGSCIGFLTLAHEERIAAAAFNHVAGHFADVVWDGLATRHVRQSLEAHVDLETLRRCWAPISPVHFASRLVDRRPKLLMVSGAYDPIFLPAHGESLAQALRDADVDFRRVVLPCGHYTLGRPPFYLIDAYLIIKFFRRYLR